MGGEERGWGRGEGDGKRMGAGKGRGCDGHGMGMGNGMGKEGNARGGDGNGRGDSEGKGGRLDPDRSMPRAPFNGAPGRSSGASQQGQRECLKPSWSEGFKSR